MPDRLYRQCLLALSCAFAALLWLGRYTDLDLVLGDWMYDRALHAFPWRHRWLTETVFHDWLTWLFVLLGSALLLALLAHRVFRTRWFGAATARKLTVVLAAAIATPLTVRLLKLCSIQHCPWSLQRYGGHAPYLRLFDPLPPGIAVGHCFPAAHASAGLWLAALCVFWLPERPGTAGVVFVLGLTPGLAMGWAQQMRGAHFLSHTLWSVWLAALVIVLLIRYLNRPARPAVPL